MNNLTFEKYPFLQTLGLTPENNGALIGGKWVGSGSVEYSINPATKEQIASIKFASPEDYNQGLELV